MPTKPSDKVIPHLRDPEPVLLPVLVSALGLKVQTASSREAVGTVGTVGTVDTVGTVERPRRSCAINKYVSENYVLDTETVSMAAGRSRSLPVTSNRRSGLGSEPAKPPLILPFLKPMGASTKGSKGRQNEDLQKPKVAEVKPCFKPKDSEEAKVSQTHMQDYFPKN